MALSAVIPQMNWTDSDLGEALGLFRQTLTLYLEDEEITNSEKQARKILRGIGVEGLRRLNNSGLKPDELKKPDKIWDYFERQLNINVNFRIHRLHFDAISSKI